MQCVMVAAAQRKDVQSGLDLRELGHKTWLCVLDVVFFLTGHAHWTKTGCGGGQKRDCLYVPYVSTAQNNATCRAVTQQREAANKPGVLVAHQVSSYGQLL